MTPVVSRRPAGTAIIAGMDIFAPLRMPPWRFLASRWPWLAIAHLLAGVVLALGTIACVAVFPLLPLWAQVLGHVEMRRCQVLLPEGSREPGRPLRIGWRMTTTAGWRQPVAAVIVGSAVALFAFFLMVVYATAVIAFVRIMRGSGIVLAGEGEPVLAGSHPLWLGALFVLGFLAVTLAFVYACAAASLAQVSLMRFLARADAEALERQVELLSRRNIDLAQAFEAERQRIERELHDGPQQHLASAAIQLGLARARLAAGAGQAGDVAQAEDGSQAGADGRAGGRAPGTGARGPAGVFEDVDSRLEAAQSELETAASALREAVRDLRPRVLEEAGLGADLAAMAESAPIDVELAYDVPGRLEAAVEASVHFVVAEFLANTYRHAGASRVSISVEWRDGVLALSLRDDGRGGADPRNGTGIVGMTNRIKLLGGSVRVESPIGGPTQLEASCPVALRGADASR